MKTLTTTHMDIFVQARMLFATATKAEWPYNYINDKPLEDALSHLITRTTQQKRGAHKNRSLTTWLADDDIEALFVSGPIISHAVEFPNMDNSGRRTECIDILKAAVRIWDPQTVANVLGWASRGQAQANTKRFYTTLASWTGTKADMWVQPFANMKSPCDLLSPELINLLKCSASLGVPLTNKIDATILEIPNDSLGPTT